MYMQVGEKKSRAVEAGVVRCKKLDTKRKARSWTVQVASWRLTRQPDAGNPEAKVL